MTSDFFSFPLIQLAVWVSIFKQLIFLNKRNTVLGQYFLPSDSVLLLQGMSHCPVYPTEVVIALDMSGDVTAPSFERMKDILLSLLKGITISRSNCPTGARVAVVSYNTNTKYVIRFTDFQRDNLLLEAVQRIPLERSSGRRNLGRAMRFVARNVFKRHRQGVLMRKVAIFLTAGPSQDATPINTAVLEFSALDITPVVVALSEVPNVWQAFSVSMLSSEGLPAL